MFLILSCLEFVEFLDVLGLLVLFCFVYNIWVDLSHHYLQNFFCFFFYFSCPASISFRHMLICLVIFYRSLGLCSLFFCSSEWIISTEPSLSSLILLPAQTCC